MNELDWRRLERRLADAHAAADPPLSADVWAGVEAAITRRPRRRPMGAVAIGAGLAVAAAAVVWLARPPDREVVVVRALVIAPAPPVSVAPPASVPDPVVLNQVLETKGPLEVTITSDAARIEVEPCRGRFVNVTVLGSPHRTLALQTERRRADTAIDVILDGAPVMASGVAHVLVPADTHLVVHTRSGAVVVRGFGGPLEITTATGAIAVDSAPRRDPQIRMTSDGGAIAWRGLCGARCRVDADSGAGEITLRAPDPAAFRRGQITAHTATGHVQFEALTCAEPSCSSPTLPWRAAH